MISLWRKGRYYYDQGDIHVLCPFSRCVHPVKFFTNEDKAVLSPAGFHFHRAETHTQFRIPIAIISLH